MAGENLSVSSTSATPSQQVSKQPTKSRIQDEEQLFSFPKPALAVAMDIAEKYFNFEINGDYLPKPAIVVAKDIVEKGVNNENIATFGKKVKANLHNSAEQIKKYQDEHPVASKFMGLVPNVVIGLDKLVNE